MSTSCWSVAAGVGCLVCLGLLIKSVLDHPCLTAQASPALREGAASGTSGWSAVCAPRARRARGALHESTTRTGLHRIDDHGGTAERRSSACASTKTWGRLALTRCQQGSCH